jgi:FdhD protein
MPKGTGKRFAKNGAAPTHWYEYKRNWVRVDAEIIEEAMVTIYVNGTEIAAIMSTPCDQDQLALGFLKNEGFIKSLDEVENVRIMDNGCCVDVWLNHAVVKPERAIITSGCGGGVTFDDPSLDLQPLQDDLRTSPETIASTFNHLQTPDSLYARTRGVHTAALVHGDQLLISADDVGRHNTIDKLVGACMLQNIKTQGRVLLATGRVSSEMLRKGALMGCPILASRNSPTSLSVTMAEAWNITLIGYVRRAGMRVYTHPERVGYREHTNSLVAGD